MYLYAMKNKSMPDLYKIGFSDDPARRAVEVSSATGVPTPFEIVDKVYCAGGAHRAEKIAHIMLDIYRVRSQREFFHLPNQNNAIQAIHLAAMAAYGFVTSSEAQGFADVVSEHPFSIDAPVMDARYSA